MNVLVVIAVTSLVVTIGSLFAVVYFIRRDRTRKRSGVLEDPVVQEAVQIRDQLPVVIARIKELQIVVAEGKEISERQKTLYEARIKQLEDLLNQASK